LCSLNNTGSLHMINRRLIRIKVLQVLYAYSKKNDGSSSLSAEKELFHSIEKFYELYILMLITAIEMAKLEEEHIEMRRNKKIRTEEDLNPSTRFADNQFIRQLMSDRQLKEIREEKKINPKIYNDIFKRIYTGLLQSELYVNYMIEKQPSVVSDRKFLIQFFTEFLAENSQFIDFLEEENIYWNDDSSFALMMVVKTIESYRENANTNFGKHILPLFKNEDDREFARKLVRNTIVNREQYLKIIEKHAQNWDTERIAQMDLLILQMAIAELFEFSSIPVKVTLNEFIEISKYYSTDKSKLFINGVLDKIIKELNKEGQIKKTGRGLIG
jgi:transcription antitermination protein NusB